MFYRDRFCNQYEEDYESVDYEKFEDFIEKCEAEAETRENVEYDD